MNTLTKEIDSDLPSVLSEMANKIKKKNAHLTLRRLANRLDISATSLTRILQKDLKKPSFNNAMKIARAAHSDDQKIAWDTIRRYYPEMDKMKDWQEVYQGNSDASFPPNCVEVLLRDPSKYEIIIESICSDGVCKDQVLAERGKQGFEVIKKLVEFGFLKEKDGRYFTDDAINATPETVYKLLENLLRGNYSLGSFGMGRNKMNILFQRLNDNAIKELREVQKESIKKIRNIFYDPKSIGTKIVWTAQITDFLNNDITQKDEQL